MSEEDKWTEFEKEMMELCPNLYREMVEDWPATKSCMVWGFEVDEGWYPLIKDLSIKLEAEILKLPEDQRKHTKAGQVKQKFGGLRFYMDGATEEIDRLIDEAEEKADITCEICGKKGKGRNHRGWLTTLCDKHEEAYQAGIDEK